MKKIFLIIFLAISFVNSSAQSCLPCPECNLQSYSICENYFEMGMEENFYTYAADLSNCLIDGVDCLQNIGFYNVTYGDVTQVIVNTSCEPGYNDCNDLGLNVYVDYMILISTAFHDCAGAAGCGNGW
ncbi:MAG: hypothetical protein WKF35_02585 [Ferruginibacter sp.]